MVKADANFSTRRPGRQARGKASEKDKHGFNGTWDVHVRRCPMAFSQPATVISTSQPDTMVRAPGVGQRKPSKRTEMRPFPAMWAKGFSGMQVAVPMEKPDRIDINKDAYSFHSMPEIPIIKPGVSALTAAETAATVIQQIHHGQMNNGTFGQPANKDKLDENFIANACHDQPFCERVPLAIVESEVKAQEQRVLDARKRLQEVMKYFGQ
ncbi:unnamed protein product [Caenorhabditis sp. 36 PRJEB53466]|nr:unnamed protein product [Caenorhabditis sp. 36 PRJEB53466]